MKRHPVFRVIREQDLPGLLDQEREAFFRFVLKHIRPEDDVLDIGAGNGAFAAMRNGPGKTCLFDGNPETVDELKRRFDHVALGQLPALPYPDGHFDACHCSHVLEHLEPECLYDTLREMDRCLRPGGVLALSFPVWWPGFHSDLSHTRPYDKEVFLKYLTQDLPAATRTRPAIAGTYRLVDELERYRRAPTVTWVSSAQGGWGSALMRKVLNAAARGIARAGMLQVQLTGRTLIFRKESEQPQGSGS